MRRSEVPGPFSLFFGGVVILAFAFIYWWFGIFPMNSRRGSPPAVLEEDPDKFWLRVGISVAVAILAIGMGIARMLKR